MKLTILQHGHVLQWGEMTGELLSDAWERMTFGGIGFRTSFLFMITWSGHLTGTWGVIVPVRHDRIAH